MIPKINGTQTLTAGVFSLKEKSVSATAGKELFAVLENRPENRSHFGEHHFPLFIGRQSFLRRSRQFHSRDCCHLLVEDTALAPEAYRPTISEEQAVVAAPAIQPHPGLTTLYQLLLEGNGSCPCQEIADARSMATADSIWTAADTSSTRRPYCS